MLNERSEGFDEALPGPRSFDAPGGSHPRSRRKAPRSSHGRSSLPSAEIQLTLLSRALEEGLAFLQPSRAESSPTGYAYVHVEAAAGLEVGDGRHVLDALAERGFLAREVFGFALLCPACGARTSEHVYLAPGERSPCTTCTHPFAFEEGSLVRIHTYSPTARARLAVQHGTLELVVDEPTTHDYAPATAPARRNRAPRFGRFSSVNRFRAGS